MPLLQVTQVRRNGNMLNEFLLDHVKNNSQRQGKARQEPRHPPARCPETRQKAKQTNQQHDPRPVKTKVASTNLHRAVTRYSTLIFTMASTN